MSQNYSTEYKKGKRAYVCAFAENVVEVLL